MKFLKVRDLEKKQHYKDRRPPWIKLHAERLDDYAFACLQDASKAHLMLLELVASQCNNRIPYDPAWIASRISSTDAIDLETLIQHGFLECFQDDSIVLAPRKQSAMPETETETEKKHPTRNKRRVESNGQFNLAPYIDAHRRVYPGSIVPTGRYGKGFKALEAKHGAPETLRRWIICLATKGDFASPEELAKHWPNYAQQNGGKPVNAAEAEQAEFRHLCKIVDTRRAKLDGDVWWERMTNDARAPTMADLYRYAAKHLEDPAYEYVPNN